MSMDSVRTARVQESLNGGSGEVELGSAKRANRRAAKLETKKLARSIKASRQMKNCLRAPLFKTLPSNVNVSLCRSLEMRRIPLRRNGY